MSTSNELSVSPLFTCNTDRCSMLTFLATFDSRKQADIFIDVNSAIVQQMCTFLRVDKITLIPAPDRDGLGLRTIQATIQIRLERTFGPLGPTREKPRWVSHWWRKTRSAEKRVIRTWLDLLLETTASLSQSHDWSPDDDRPISSSVLCYEMVRRLSLKAYCGNYI